MVRYELGYPWAAKADEHLIQVPVPEIDKEKSNRTRTKAHRALCPTLVSF